MPREAIGPCGRLYGPSRVRTDLRDLSCILLGLEVQLSLKAINELRQRGYDSTLTREVSDASLSTVQLVDQAT